ncbi:MAG: hypothetical protein NZ825_04405 [Candidatus Marinimicrobia bacterium]|nr:hypothetical protein [Candidatus Neomarinimicrobiota bacterium]
MISLKFPIICLLFCCQTIAKDINITDLKVEVKKNGVFLKIRSNKSIPKSAVTGWYSDNGWFYVTIMNAFIDTNLVENIKYPAPVKKIIVHNLEESVQISLAVPIIETHEFLWYGNPRELLVSLRFPPESITPVFAEAKLNNKRNVNLESELNYSRMRNAALLIGSSLSIAGIVDSDGQGSIGWELPTGLGLLIVTYMYDRYIKFNK